MADDITTTPVAKPASDLRAEAIKAWHEADTDAKKAAAVKQFPILAEMYALAATLKGN